MPNGSYTFNREMQLKILTLLWRDKAYYSTYRSAIKPKYFTNSVLVDLCRIIFDYQDQYGNSPGVDVLKQEVSELCNGSKTKVEADYIDTIDSMSDMELYDIEYMKEKIISFGKRQALVDAILEGAQILEKKPETEYSRIQDMVNKALMVGEDTGDLGLDLWEDIEERFIGYCQEDDVIERIPTDIELLDECLGGGLGRTEMGCIVAPPGRGKTTTLISIGGGAIEHGYSVLHISFENNQHQILRNYDIRLMRHSMDYITSNLPSAVSAMNRIKQYRKGQLIVKKYPTREKTVNDIRLLLDQLKLVKGFVPDVLIVDYGAIIKPSHFHNDKRNMIESNYEELRALADDYNLALWTAAQGNRAALSKKIVSMGDLAECFAIGNIVDVMGCLSQTDIEKQDGTMRMFMSKIRDNPDGKLLAGKILYDLKRLELDREVSQDSYVESDDWES